ncbi:MAG: serine/threonine protein kinase [Verrucomicrobiae bacterium]|nr:serine/threonine protein kinase [Verrucomicrobiae bacterium]
MESIPQQHQPDWRNLVSDLDQATDSTRNAVAQIFATYSSPLYSYAREWGSTPSESVDLLKSFFARVRGDAAFLSALELERPALRTFILYGFKVHRAESMKIDSGGNKFHLNIPDSALEERRSQLHVESMTPEALFDFHWAHETIRRAWDRYSESSTVEASANGANSEFRRGWANGLVTEVKATLSIPDRTSVRRELRIYIDAMEAAGHSDVQIGNRNVADLAVWALEDFESADSDDTSDQDIFWTPPTVNALAALFPELEVLDFIGRGGMSGIYEVRQKDLNRTVALKLSRSQETEDSILRERFIREARAIAGLNHPNIVTLFDFGFRTDHTYLLLELVKGGDVKRLLKSGNVPLDVISRILCQLCDALQYVHDQGIVHRDIKPGNILLDQAQNVKLADFGLVKLPETASEALSLTVTGKMVGTPKYLAPEQVDNAAEVDHRADVFSVGVVFYQLLTDTLPIGRFEPPSELRKVTSNLDAIAFKALARDPDQRYQRVSDMGADIMAALPAPDLDPCEKSTTD